MTTNDSDKEMVMPTATQSTGGTDKFTDFEAREYPLRLVTLKNDTFTDQQTGERREQFQWLIAIEGFVDPETGEEYRAKTWTSLIWNDTPGKESHLVLLTRAFTARPVTYHEFEGMTFDDFAGLRARGLVKLNKKGYPNIDKESVRPARATNGTTPARAQTTLPAAPAPPRTVDPATGEVTTTAAAPDAAGGRGPMTDRQLRQIVALMGSEGLDEETVNTHCRPRYGRKYDELDEAQAEELKAAIGDGTVVPF